MYIYLMNIYLYHLKYIYRPNVVVGDEVDAHLPVHKENES